MRPAAMWDAIYELALGNVAGITPEGAQALVDDGIAAHEAKEDPHTVYVTTEEGDLRWGASSGLAPHTHEATDSGGLIDYLRTQWGTDHLAAANPHSQYLQTPAVQAMIDAALANYYTKAQADTAFLTQAEGDLLYLPIGYTPPPTDLSNYWTKAQADGRFVDVAGDTMTGDLTISKTAGAGDPLRITYGGTYPRFAVDDAGAVWIGSGASRGVKLQSNVGGSALFVGGSPIPNDPATNDVGASTARWRKLWTTDADVLTGLVVASKAVALSPDANQTLEWRANGFYSSAPTKATYDAALARITALEAKVAALEGQMGSGATGHTHPMATWQSVGKPIIPVTQAVVEEAVSA